MEIKLNNPFKAKSFVLLLSAISLVSAPLLTFIGWAISHNSIHSFLDFNFIHKDTNATVFLTASSDPNLVFRYYLLPHYFIYFSMPFYIVLALTILYLTYKSTSWLSFIGTILAIIGSVYFVGVLGAYLSTPIGSVIMTPILKISFVLCFLVFIGNIILGLALYKSNILPKWVSFLFMLGNVLILIFPGIENWMSVGSLMMIIAMAPLSLLMIKRL